VIARHHPTQRDRDWYPIALNANVDRYLSGDGRNRIG
jgi:hypothetical protein